MRILIAPDKFKGSLTATEAAASIHAPLAAALPDCQFDLCPIADGGEGTSEAIRAALAGEWISATVCDAQGRPRHAQYAWIADSKANPAAAGEQACGTLAPAPAASAPAPSHCVAVMEMSAASGLAIVSDLPLNPAAASTFGTGQLLAHAIARGARRIIIGIGGSATNDAGLGMAAALGYRFLSATGADLPAVLQEALHIARILPPDHWRDRATPPTEILVACDVTNPLLGPSGATRVYGPQKGIAQADFPWFESRLEHLANLASRDLGIDARDLPGAGAAGGLGFGLTTFCHATLTSGFDLISAQIGLPARVAAADLIITGEGRLDSQSLHGKGPAALAALARSHGKPVIAFAGSIERSPALDDLFTELHPITPPHMPLAEALHRAPELLSQAVAQALPLLMALDGH